MGRDTPPWRRQSPSSTRGDTRLGAERGGGLAELSPPSEAWLVRFVEAQGAIWSLSGRILHGRASLEKCWTTEDNPEVRRVSVCDVPLANPRGRVLYERDNPVSTN